MSLRQWVCKFILKSLVISQVLYWSVEAYRPNNYTLIEWINSQHLTWRAGPNPTNVPDPSPRRRRKKSSLPLLIRNVVRTPPTFDARSHWPHCRDIIDRIRSQGGCGSCWAVAAVSVLSDRTCIESSGYYQLHLSAEDVMACCSTCSDSKDGACGGGYEDRAIKFWAKDGIVTGGELGSLEGCKPYSWDSFSNKNTPCRTICTNRYYERTYFRDQYRGRIAYNVPSSEDAIKNEIFQHGPVTAAMDVFDDFYQYRNGVYIHKTGLFRNPHAVRIIGWGLEHGVKYWLIANSHGTDFGMRGYIRFLRGENHCGIENEITAGSMYRANGKFKYADGETMRQAPATSASIKNSVLVEILLLCASSICIFKWSFWKSFS